MARLWSKTSEAQRLGSVARWLRVNKRSGARILNVVAVGMLAEGTTEVQWKDD
jgi:hypothetical protein